ncbi:hypothetical protein [Pontiella agarivorans]|uniref:Uncharacterized protein n=1 Tax=Pontiella agarivorans TaxID=3038953 RepID=A0ABU5MV49_9BACT|nr:hypothetical protein [Pontiella agarivorans]MDZ8118101.1 hypothetical protein [Pontiella agarivorans]
MNLPKLEKFDSERFMHEAFDKTMRARWKKRISIRRNVYLCLFLIGMLCMLYTALIARTTLCILSLALAIISLVVMTKYETQLHFLKILQTREKQKNSTPDYS